jgi:acyl dehydratase
MSQMLTDAGEDWRHGRITDAALAEMRAQIGIRQPISSAWSRTASADAIWHFALGVGDDNPLWWRREYAEKSPAGRMYAPPTFLYVATHEFPPPGAEPAVGDADWLPGVMGLWAGDRWEWHSRVWLDEPVYAYRELAEVGEREGSFAGRSIVQGERMTFERENGDMIAELHRTVLRFERTSSRTRNKYLDVPEATYTEAEMAGIRAQYAREAGARRGGEPRYWEDVAVGDAVSPLVKGPLTVTNLIGWMLGWGSPQCPTNRILYSWLDQHPAARLSDPRSGVDHTLEVAHWSEYFARESGMARGYDFGAQRISWLAHVVLDWCGDEGELVGLDARLRAPNFLGDTTWFTGRVTGKSRDEGSAAVDLDLTGTNQRGEVTATATAKVKLPTRSV